MCGAFSCHHWMKVGLRAFCYGFPNVALWLWMICSDRLLVSCHCTAWSFRSYQSRHFQWLSWIVTTVEEVCLPICGYEVRPGARKPALAAISNISEICFYFPQTIGHRCLSLIHAWQDRGWACGGLHLHLRFWFLSHFDLWLGAPASRGIWVAN